MFPFSPGNVVGRVGDFWALGEHGARLQAAVPVLSNLRSRFLLCCRSRGWVTCQGPRGCPKRCVFAVPFVCRVCDGSCDRFGHASGWSPSHAVMRNWDGSEVTRSAPVAPLWPHPQPLPWRGVRGAQVTARRTLRECPEIALVGEWHAQGVKEGGDASPRAALGNERPKETRG